MSVFEKFRRARIYTSVQHPLRHSFSDIVYTNQATGGQVTSVQSALDWLFAVLYPQTKPSVPNQAALPLGGNTINDMRVVDDDGDGKAASYRWEKREGEVSASWHKIYDMDWGVDSILQQMYLKTQDIYASKIGYDDRDGAGNVVVGTLAGQSIYGGATANTNLTLFANSGDGTGASTGFVQFGDQVRPTANNTIDLGTTGLRFKKVWANEYQAGTLNLQSGNIVDSSGAISFGATNLSTTGSLSVGSLSVSSLTLGTLSLTSGSIVDSSGTISFTATNLVTTGTLGSNVLTLTKTGQTIVLNPDVGGKASLTVSHAILTFGAANLETTGTINSGNITATRLDVDNLRVDLNTISVTNANGNLVLVANGSGIVDVQSGLTTLSITATGTVDVVGQLLVDNLSLNLNTLASTDANGDIILAPNGTGRVVVNTVQLIPNSDAGADLGAAATRFGDVYFAGVISDGTNQIDVSTALMSLRAVKYRNFAQTLPAQNGDALFYDSVNGVWLASAPDSEITHGGLSGLGADDHTQYLLLAGRGAGQSIVGGANASANLTLESTANATKGKILFKDTIQAFTDANFAVSWQGTDIGGSSNRFRHVYTAGEFFGLRLENVGALPASSSQRAGRLMFYPTDGKVYLDTGSAIAAVGSGASSITDTSWDGVQTQQTFTVAGLDARNAIWQISDNTNNFAVIYASIEKLSATQVRVTATTPLAAGTYRLIGLA